MPETTSVLADASMPAPALIEAFDRDGYAIIRDAYEPGLRAELLAAARRLLTSTFTQGRDRGGDGKDGFRGCLALDDTFLPLLASPRTLPALTAPTSASATPTTTPPPKLSPPSPASPAATSASPSASSARSNAS